MFCLKVRIFLIDALKKSCSRTQHWFESGTQEKGFTRVTKKKQLIFLFLLLFGQCLTRIIVVSYDFENEFEVLGGI